MRRFGSRRGRAAAAYAADPLSIAGSNLELWLRSDRGITTVSGDVSAWRDQSGKGRHFSQSNAANRYAYNATDSNWGGLPSLTGDGLTKHLVSDDAASAWTFLHDGNGMTWIIVHRPKSGTDDTQILLTTGGLTSTQVGILSYHVVTSVNRGFATSNGTDYAVAVEAAETLDANEWVMGAYEEGRAGNEVEMWRNGTSLVTGDSALDPSASAPNHTLRIGYSSSAPDHDLVEVILISKFLSAAEIAAFGTYMTTRYGI